MAKCQACTVARHSWCVTVKIFFNRLSWRVHEWTNLDCQRPKRQKKVAAPASALQFSSFLSYARSSSAGNLPAHASSWKKNPWNFFLIYIWMSMMTGFQNFLWLLCKSFNLMRENSSESLFLKLAIVLIFAVFTASLMSSPVKYLKQ